MLNGHCNSPIAGFSTIDGAQMSLTASVLDEAGGLFIEVSRSGPADRPRELGRAVGLELLDKGAAEIIERSRPGMADPPQMPCHPAKADDPVRRSSCGDYWIPVRMTLARHPYTPAPA